MGKSYGSGQGQVEISEPASPDQNHNSQIIPHPGRGERSCATHKDEGMQRWRCLSDPSLITSTSSTNQMYPSIRRWTTAKAAKEQPQCLQLPHKKRYPGVFLRQTNSISGMQYGSVTWQIALFASLSEPSVVLPQGINLPPSGSGQRGLGVELGSLRAHQG